MLEVEFSLKNLYLDSSRDTLWQPINKYNMGNISLKRYFNLPKYLLLVYKGEEYKEFSYDA